MKLIGLMPVRNEDWCLGLTARAALQWCDELILYTHACDDDSALICRDIEVEHLRVPGDMKQGFRAHWLANDDPVWHEMEHRQDMLNAARAYGATHIALIDADEILSGNLIRHTEEACDCIRCLCQATPPGTVLQLPWPAIRCEGPEFGYIGDQQDPVITFAFEDSPRFFWAAEVRSGYDFHRRHPFYKGGKDNFYWPVGPGEGGVMHLQFLSNRRLRAKQALYQMTEVIRWPGRAFGIERPDAAEQLAKTYGRTTYRYLNAPTIPCPESWWAPYAELMKHLHIDAVPWQELECKKLWAEHGPEKFKGLDLFGVVA